MHDWFCQLVENWYARMLYYLGDLHYKGDAFLEDSGLHNVC